MCANENDFNDSFIFSDFEEMDPQSSFIDQEPIVPYGTRVYGNPDDTNSYVNQPGYNPNVPPEFYQNGLMPPPNNSSEESEYGDTESDYPPPNIIVAENEPSIVLTDIANIREVLATRTCFHGVQLGSHLKNHQGLIILPLHAVSLLRMPTGHHTGNPPCLVFHPVERLENYDRFPQFQESIKMLYDNKPQN